MSHFYLDASAVVKRYSLETGSAWVKVLTDPLAGHTIDQRGPRSGRPPRAHLRSRR